MKAPMCHEFGPENLRVEDVADPVLGPGQLLVEVKAASINFPDALIVQGRYQVKTTLPFSPGAEAAGVVRALGEGAKGFEPGDRVVVPTGHGAFAELCVAEAARASKLPEGMSFEQ